MGTSEEATGTMLADLVPRNTSRRALMHQLDQSLERSARLTWTSGWCKHAATPVDEARSALESAVASGRAHYAGVSNTRDGKPPTLRH
jgi:aryl-alcohol dehydrogenase-like predicted oxidoreductase